ncbi:MAG: glutamate-1-semialdehyde 2,1-aminomutase [Bacteroidota bacterium]|nr:glutamate-1-semialdehyde 2,1-aminomutase [Candidatus Kapabacteria bacterium]MDW8220126.1 glutamate-1-semialdehyde 2,1-aminomutase [Bacteroidota bacterium]
MQRITNFTKSNEYRSVIHDLIPGGAHTYSRGDDQFPALSPAAISHGKGAYVWDIDGNKYLDCPMGLTSVSLGHAYEPVLERVRAELAKGVNFQRPSYIEREMAETFLSLVPQHQMIKFAKNGSTVTTAAVKLARGYTGRKLIAFPGDHPFYSFDDWFIGKTPCNLGVPDEISALSVTYKGCDIDSLRELFNQYPGQIAAVITEPERNACGNGCGCPYGKEAPKRFLQEAIELAHNEGALFIVDEMITGFKTHFPGTIVKYGIEPDLTTWGKGIANGFSFCALTGRKEVMELGGIRNKGAEKLFLISSTHGGETHAIAAGLATISEFMKHNVVAHNHAIGERFIARNREVIARHGLSDYIEVVPAQWMPIMIFKDANGEVSSGLRTLVMQEMIARGVLFQGAFVPCFSHTEDDVEFFAEAMGETLEVFVRALENGFEQYLVGEPVKPVFRKVL